jgi:sulfite exporter TauE/SafE
MWVLFGTVFVASLLGSLHCVGMCGPFAMVAAADPERRHSALVPTTAYSLGRLASYSIVGLIFGTVGMAINQTATFSHWQQLATFIAGGLMILVGCIALARQLGVRVRLPKTAAPLQNLLQVGYRHTTQMPPLSRALTIGFLSSLMPCGWLYTFAITAAGTGSPVWGMLLMVSFWAGTVPIMAALMLGIGKFGQKFQKKVPLIMASVVILLGCFTLAYRAPIALGGQTEVVSGVDALVEQVNSVDHGDMPCCSQD